MNELSKECKEKIDFWRSKFPKDKARSAILMALRVVQDEKGWLSDESLELVADYLNVPRVEVFEVVSFYSMYNRKPVGKHTIAVCNSLSCYLCKCNDLVGHLEKKLGIKPGETTKDGMFTLKYAECLAACGGAPAVLVGDDEYHQHMTSEKLDVLIEKLSGKE